MATPGERQLRARIAAYSLHARRDPKETTAKARAAFLRRFDVRIKDGRVVGKLAPHHVEHRVRNRLSAVEIPRFSQADTREGLRRNLLKVGVERAAKPVLRRAVHGRGLALLLEHVGSTSVPGLSAKPVIDYVLEVPDSRDEASYVPALEDDGFVLRIREPDWFEHRLLKTPSIEGNLHVFSAGCDETRRMLLFRDWLRTHDDDRKLYEDTKDKLSAQIWAYTQDYADAKSEVVSEILARAEGR